MHVGPLEVTAPKRNLAGIARIWVGLGGICGERRLGCRRHWITGSRDGSHDRVDRILVAVAVQKRKVLSKRSMSVDVEVEADKFRKPYEIMICGSHESTRLCLIIRSHEIMHIKLFL